MGPDQTGRVWDEVRRALGRLAGRATVHRLPEAWASVTASVRHSEAIEIADPTQGVRQTEWQPSSQVATLPSVSATAGGNDIDLAAVATVIGANSALGNQDVAIYLIQHEVESASTHVCGLNNNWMTEKSGQGGHVHFSAPQVTQLDLISDQLNIHAQPTDPPALAKPHRRRSASWQFPCARVRSGVAAILQVPLTCERLSPPPAMTLSEAFDLERHLLSKSAGTTVDDVDLIGVFPHVPLRAIDRLSIAPGGAALLISIRPETLRDGAKVSTVTVVLGRQRSTGKVLQVAKRPA